MGFWILFFGGFGFWVLGFCVVRFGVSGKWENEREVSGLGFSERTQVPGVGRKGLDLNFQDSRPNLKLVESRVCVEFR